VTQPSLTLWKSAEPKPIVARVAIAGDFLPAGSLSVPVQGWAEATQSIQPLFNDVALSFVNLECPLDSQTLPARPLDGIGDIVSASSDSLDYLQSIRCVPVSIANNHSYDHGAAGVARTRAALAQRNFVPLGAGRTLREPPAISIWQGPGKIRVGFWAAARASRDLATRRTEGVELATVARARHAAAALQSQGAQFSIALLHAGCLRTNRSDPDDISLVDAIATCGFDLVAASHSHRISGSRLLRTHQQGPSSCFYGLGSIVSGYVASPLEREGLFVVAGFSENGALASIEVRPVLLGDSGFGEVPSPEIARQILDRFCSLTAEIADGSATRRFYEDVSRGFFPLYVRDVRAAFSQSGFAGLARKAGRIRARHLRRLLHGVSP
jgi:Bacterial capsule synthesis protein PGA_cap